MGMTFWKLQFPVLSKLELLGLEFPSQSLGTSKNTIKAYTKKDIINELKAKGFLK